MTGKSEVKVPDEKCQLEMVYNEDISQLRVVTFRVISLAAARSVF